RRRGRGGDRGRELEAEAGASGWIRGLAGGVGGAVVVVVLDRERVDAGAVERRRHIDGRALPGGARERAQPAQIVGDPRRGITRVDPTVGVRVDVGPLEARAPVAGEIDAGAITLDPARVADREGGS